MMASFAPPESNPALEEVEIHSVLANERRQMTLQILREGDGQLTARELSERIAEIETGQSPPPRNIRQSAYVSLIQTHLPKLDDLDIIEYDNGRKSVSLSTSAEQLSTFNNSEPEPTSDGRYLVVSFLGLVIIVISRVTTSSLASVVALDVAGLLFLVMVGMAVYRERSNDWPLLRRVPDR